MVQYISEQEIINIVYQFKNHTLPLELWTHEAHLTLAIWHLKKYTYAEATCMLRSGIITYNSSTGGVNNSTTGYHETITLFWIKVVADFLRKHLHLTPLAACNAFLASSISSKTYPYEFYSKALLHSTHARSHWTAPDLKPLQILEMRPALLDDLDQLRHLYYDTITTVNRKDYNDEQIAIWASTYGNLVLWEERFNSQHFFVAHMGKSVLGFCSIDKDGYIDFLFVHKDHQKQGVATELLKAIELFATNLDVKKVWADVSLTAKSFFCIMVLKSPKNISKCTKD